MGILRTWEEWGERAGSGIKDYVGDTGEIVLKGVCKLYSKYPKGLVLNPYAKGFAKGLCEQVNEPLPDVPPPPFEGGKCDTLYYAWGRYTNKNSSGCDGRGYWKSQYGVNPNNVVSFTPKQAPWGAFAIELRDGNWILVRPINKNYYDAETLNDEPAIPIYYRAPEQECRNVNTPTYGHSFATTKVRRKDGNPDNCGSYDPEFPPDPETDPNDFEYNTTINIYNNEGNVTNTENINVNISPNLSPDFEVSISLGDTNIDVDLSGYYVTNRRSGGGGAGTSDTEEELEEEEQEEQEEEEKEVEGIKYALIIITKFPDKGKTILQTKSVNNTYFAGYFSWLVKINGVNYRKNEVPIRKEKTALKAPDDATGYAYYTVNGAVLKVTEYIQK